MDWWKRPCSREFIAFHSSGARPSSWIKHIVVHSAEALSARGVARFFSEPGAGGSANLVTDDKECFRTLNDHAIPWGAPGANESGWHIELCGRASWTREEWLRHRPMLKAAAYKCALRAKQYEIPLRWIGPLRLRLGWKGFVTHNTVSKAFKRSTHWDPGPGFPQDLFMDYVKAAHAKL